MSLVRTSVENSHAHERSRSKASGEYLLDLHAKRIEALSARDESMLAEAGFLSTFLKSEPEIAEVENVSDIRYKYPLTATQTFYSTIAGHNIPTYSYCYPAKLKSREKGIQWIIAKEVQIKNFKPFPAQFLQAYSLLKYFAGKKLFCQRIFDMFRIRSKNVYVFLMTLPVEYQSIRSALLNGRIVNSSKNVDEETVALDAMIQQLISGAEQLNLCGVAHRFLTVDNVFIGPEKNIQFGSFDFATVFFNPESQMKILCARGLGIPLPPEYHEHLPPEAFTTSGYDASMTDIWSIGVLLCRILIGATPFEALTRGQASDPGLYFRHWRESECRPMIPDAYRMFIDDIFRPANERMTLADLLSDPFFLKKAPKRAYPYYRIDIREAINLEKPPKSANPFNMEVFSNRAIPKVSDEVKRAFHAKDQFRFAERLEDIFADYTIDIAGSFSDELKQFTDVYYKAFRSKQPCVLRIFCHSYPSRYRKLMASESCKIARLCQTSGSKGLFHEIYDIFITPNGKSIWVFYADILNFRPLSAIAGNESSAVQLRRLIAWLLDVVHALEVLSECLAAHRYIRPEFILIHNETGSVKVSHPDMAGFAVNPEHEKLSPRTSGMQDECEAMWAHAPPEMWDARYDISTFDVWSFGVLICYCLTRGRWPFATEQLRSNWMGQWVRYRTKYSPSLEAIPEVTDFLNKIFVDWEQRATVGILDRRLREITKKVDARETTRQTPSGKGVGKMRSTTVPPPQGISLRKTEG